MKTYLRKDFIKLVSEKIEREYPQDAIYWVTKAVFACMVDIIRDGDKLHVHDKFDLEPKLKKERRVGGFGKPCVISSHYVPYFKPGRQMKRACAELTNRESEEKHDDSE